MTVTLVPRDPRDRPRVYKDIVALDADARSIRLTHAGGNVFTASRTFWEDTFYVDQERER